MSRIAPASWGRIPLGAISTRKGKTMTDVIQLRPTPPTESKPTKVYGDDDWLLRMCSQWRFVRALQQKNWAEHDEATLFSSLPDANIELDTEPLDRMKDLEFHISRMEPRTTMLARELLGVAATILAFSKEDPESVLAQGPILEIILNVKNALEHCDGTMKVGPSKKKRRGAAHPPKG
jgi:hypothetical protein